jgi:hypothetical protein
VWVDGPWSHRTGVTCCLWGALWEANTGLESVDMSSPVPATSHLLKAKHDDTQTFLLLVDVPNLAGECAQNLLHALEALGEVIHSGDYFFPRIRGGRRHGGRAW